MLRHLGTLLVLTGLLVGTSVALDAGGATTPDPAPVAESATVELPPAPSTTGPPASTPDLLLPTPTPESRLPITRVVVPSIGLDVEVRTAPLVESHGQRTWSVPAFKAGHAEDTAGAGERGNAVLMGHISSVHAGDVFKNLDRIQIGDQIEVFSGERRFTYRVYETRSVKRTDLALVESTPEPVISLFTCTGAWDPLLWDFTERLFVRARLDSDT